MMKSFCCFALEKCRTWACATSFFTLFIFPLVFGVDKARLPGGLARIPPLFRFQQLVRAAFFLVKHLN